MNTVFLSASVPLPTRHPQFYETADPIAIKEAVKSLVVEIIPRGRIVFGGHPAITPLISLMISSLFPDHGNRAVLFQSLEFEGRFPPEVEAFPTVIYTPRQPGGLNDSLLEMRRQMIGDYKYDAAVFIGGMEGVIEEYKIFRECHPNCLVLPLASTGAAANIIFEEGKFDKYLKNDINYSSIFRRLI